MKATSFVAAALLAAGTSARAQEPPTVQPVMYLLPVTFPLLAPAAQEPPAPQQPVPPPAAASADRRDDIKTLEAVLTMAVRSGADKLALQMRASEPGSLFVIDSGRTRGFDLQGYGVFFDVDVPMMKQSVLYVTRQQTQQDNRAQLENSIATLPAGPLRELAMRELQRINQQQGMRQGATQVAQPGFVSALNADAPTPPTMPTGSPAAAGIRPEPDPNELYTEAVKTSLIDAMLKYSVGLKLGPDEWLTVAARDAQGSLNPGQVDDASTILIRIKGADLTAFHAGKLTREDVLKKVEVKEI